MTIFDQIKYVAFTKQHIDVMQTDQPVSPYMLQRWLSMYSPPIAMLINAMTNQLWKGNTDPQQFVNLLEVVVPKLQFARISYIKKPLAEQVDDKKQAPIEIIAQLLQISQKEAAEYCQQDPTLASKFQDAGDVFRKTRLNDASKND